MSNFLPNRISWTEKNGERLIVIHGRVERWLEGLLLGWTMLWFGIGLLMLWQLLGPFEYSNQERRFIMVFLLFWAYFLYKAAYAYSWRKYGKELIKITEDAVIFKRDMRTYGKAKRFLRANIKEIRKAEFGRFSFAGAYQKSFWVVTGGNVHFSYLGKVIQVGQQLEEADADQLIKLLRKPVRTKA